MSEYMHLIWNCRLSEKAIHNYIRLLDNTMLVVNRKHLQKK